MGGLRDEIVPYVHARLQLSIFLFRLTRPQSITHEAAVLDMQGGKEDLERVSEWLT